MGTPICLYGHYKKEIVEFDGYSHTACGIEEFVTQPSGPPQNTPGYEYAGKKRDSATRLYYFAHRYYDSEIGRFITEDPAKQGYNWYAFCGNNALKYTDPDGRWFGFDNTFTSPVDEILVFGGLSIAAALLEAHGQFKKERNLLILLPIQ
jgi:RHS repeat-associated protein